MFRIRRQSRSLMHRPTCVNFSLSIKLFKVNTKEYAVGNIYHCNINVLKLVVSVDPMTQTGTI